MPAERRRPGSVGAAIVYLIVVYEHMDIQRQRNVLAKYRIAPLACPFRQCATLVRHYLGAVAGHQRKKHRQKHTRDEQQNKATVVNKATAECLKPKETPSQTHPFLMTPTTTTTTKKN